MDWLSELASKFGIGKSKHDLTPALPPGWTAERLERELAEAERILDRNRESGQVAYQSREEKMAAVYELIAEKHGIGKSAEILPSIKDYKPDLDRVIRELEKGWVEERLVLETDCTTSAFDKMLAELVKNAPQKQKDRGLELE